tara:strand:- start:387 stop:590 length:204 start_codon:yes stop_codon:yes gene_type:complete
MTWILVYFSIGILFNLLMDLLVDHFENTGIENHEEMRFDLFTKVLTGLLWPLAIIYIAVVAYKHYKK